MNTDTHTIPAPPKWLGLGGLLPFAASAAAAFAGEPSVSQFALLSLGAYGAVILSFLGGVKWGMGINDRAAMQRWPVLIMSVVPSLIAWPTLLLPTPWMLLILVAGFGVQYLADRRSVETGELPHWFGRLRLILTVGALSCLLAGLLAALL